MKTTFLLMIGLFATSCSTVGAAITTSSDAWINVARSGTPHLFYCRANPTTAGESAPVCNEPRFEEHKDPAQPAASAH